MRDSFYIQLMKEKKIFFKKFFKKFKSNTLLALEFRTTKDNLMRKGKKLSSNERYTDHYRRFIDVKKFEKKFWISMVQLSTKDLV